MSDYFTTWRSIGLRNPIITAYFPFYWFSINNQVFAFIRQIKKSFLNTPFNHAIQHTKSMSSTFPGSYFSQYNKRQCSVPFTEQLLSRSTTSWLEHGKLRFLKLLNKELKYTYCPISHEVKTIRHLKLVS